MEACEVGEWSLEERAFERKENSRERSQGLLKEKAKGGTPAPL